MPRFDKMSKEELRAVSARGGRAAHAKGKAHKFTEEESKRGGKKRGECRECMQEIGKTGGHKAHEHHHASAPARDKDKWSRA